MSGWRKYMENEIKTSNPGKITVMAYERIILTLKQVKIMLVEKKWDEASEKLMKIHRLINELSSQLDHSAAPELAGNLESLYYWIGTEVQIINASKNAEKIDGVVDVVQDLLDGYRGALQNMSQNKQEGEDGLSEM